MKTGWAHYKKHDIDYVKCSNEVFFTKELVEFYLSLLHHGWLSLEGKSEAYNESHRNSKKVEIFKEFLTSNKHVGGHFKKRKCATDDGGLADDINIPDNDEFNEGQISNTMYKMHRKNLSQAVYRHWIHEELKERKKLGKILFGPRFDKDGSILTYEDSVEDFLAKVDAWRTDEIYEHADCTGKMKIKDLTLHNKYVVKDACLKRGCGSVWSMDGLWKLAYPIW